MKTKSKRGHVQSLVGLEIGYTYRFPAFEVILALLVYAAFVSTLSSTFSYGISVRRSPDYNGTLVLTQVETIVKETQTRVLGSAFYTYTHLLAILIPLLTSLSIANSYEDGTLKTFLTYPVRRFSLLAVKISHVVILPGLVATLASTLAIYIFIPEMTSMISEFVLLIGAMWIFIILLMSVTALISVFSRRITISAVGGIAFWYAIQLLLNLGGLPPVFSQMLNPLGTAITFVSATGSSTTLFTDLISSLVGALAAGILISSLSFFIFERADI